MMKLCIFMLLLILIILFGMSKNEHFTQNPNKNVKESNKTKYKYIINDTIGGRKAVIYDISKFVKLPNDLGNGLKFNGINSYMVVPEVNYSTYSISLIFKNLFQTDKQILMSSTSGGFLVTLENGYLGLTFYSDSDVKKIVYKRKLNTKEYYHFVLTYDGRKVKMYLNGNLTETDVKKTNVCKMLVLGTDISKRHCFNGIIGKINIFHRILNLTEVCALHELCNIEKPKVKIEAEEEQEKKPKCKFIPAGDTKAKCSEICMSKDNCDEVVCKNLCNNCSDSEYCAWLKPPPKKTCSFIPYGPSKVSCINTCVKEDNCDYLNCQKICLNCQDTETCPWLDPLPIKKKEEDEIEPPPVYDPEGKPLPPQIHIKTYNGKVKITWDKPYPGDSHIEAYICFLFKTFKKQEGVSINMVPFPKCEECVHILDNLDPEETYSVGVRAFNNLGLSQMSNIETFKPYKTFNKKVTKILDNNLVKKEYVLCNKN